MSIKELASNNDEGKRKSGENSSQKMRTRAKSEIIPDSVISQLRRMVGKKSSEYSKSIVQLSIENGINPGTITKRLYRMRFEAKRSAGLDHWATYTDNELSVLFKEVEKTPYNLQNAFENASVKLGRSTAAITAKWYELKRNGLIPKFVLGSVRGATGNTKNVYRVDGVMPEVKTKPILTVVALMMELSDEQREAIFTIFK